MTISIAAKTDPGKERDQNEDAFVFCPDLSHPEWDLAKAIACQSDLGTLLAVADGMGGANAGEVASAIAIETIKQCFSQPNLSFIASDEMQITAFLNTTIKTADKAIKDYIVKDPETIGMGTTIVICWIVKDKAFVAWCGDSRCYVYNPAQGLKALTKDHSYVQELVDSGQLTEEEAFFHPDNNIITRGLGDIDTEVGADIVSHAINPNDVFLLCSDGLCGYCRKQAIEKVLNHYYQNVPDCCEKLMGLALAAGGYDNICIVLAGISDEDL